MIFYIKFEYQTSHPLSSMQCRLAPFFVQDLQQDFSARFQAAKEDADAKNVEIVAELDKFRRAFAGDPLGWAAATDEQGKPYYFNSETGE